MIEVKGRAATVFGLTQPNGTHGLVAEAGRRFRVRLENRLDEETLIHWHGLTPPWQQDGVPLLSQPPLAPGAGYDYDFPLDRPGTNWMHSHHGLQEQRLMAAPLIIRDPAEAGEDIQDVVVLFHDFTFRDPDEILAGLKGGGHGAVGHGATQDSPGLLRRTMETVMPMRGMDHGAGHGGMDHGAMGAGMVHLHDVEYDAFLANDRTLDDPEVFRVERGGRVRLRLINGATATNFWLDLGRLEGRLVAVDGMPVAPVDGQRFEFAIAQRLDILIDLPADEGAWPVFAVREGERARTGFILATPRGTIEKVASDAAEPVQPVGLALERRLRATQPLALRQADRRHTVTITEAPGYVWLLNGAAHGDHTLDVRTGERVEITFNDQTTMAHPMHLHGHHFQVVAINGERIAGAVRDTVLVPARGSVTIAFDADNPGKWALHCHHLYHMASGMMTALEYQS
ncbi:multicopper oxidase family protein [Chelatococcus daeguensis]|uniref:multicopper oxidase family protein n=1 Tax=Chelatococcus daeguensis TaxID=444444 RepID=UPI0032AED63D